jgi:NADPH2:quinone reductase
MKAVRIQAPGGAEALVLEDVPRPEPKAGEALVRIEAAGVNFIDVYFRTGAYKAASFPLTLGQEGAGVVEAVGSGVSNVKSGDRVASVNFAGSYAQYAVAPADRLVPVPQRVTGPQAAAAMLQGMTAEYLAESTYSLAPGHVCLVHAAAGGVGQLLCQIARMKGATVIGTAGGPEHAAVARAAGAEHVIDYKTADFEAEVRRITEGRGVNVVYDSVGRTTFEKSLNCLARRGFLVLFGQSSGAVGPIDPQVLNQKGSLYLTRPSLFHYVATREELLERSEKVLGWVASGRLRLKIDRELPLSQAADAHRILEDRKSAGKILLKP